MMLWFRNIFAYFICAIASVAAVRWIESTVVADVLVPNLTAIVVALLAINVQTTAVIAVKLRELADKNGCNFSATVNEFRIAICEQGALVISSLALSALLKSKIFFDTYSVGIEVASFFVIYASLHIFLDTTICLLVALFPEQNTD